MKDIKLNAKLSAYSKISAIKCESPDIEEMTTCDVDMLFGEHDTPCDVCETKSNEVSCADIDALFS